MSERRAQDAEPGNKNGKCPCHANHPNRVDTSTKADVPRAGKGFTNDIEHSMRNSHHNENFEWPDDPSPFIPEQGGN